MTKRKEEASSKRKSVDMFSRSDGKIKIVDVLANSLHLPKGVIIKDILRHGCDNKRIDSSIALPLKTMESYYQQIADGLLQYDSDVFLNEVLPLLYLSLRYQSLFINEENKLTEDPFIHIHKLDDFIIHDQDFKVLDP